MVRSQFAALRRLGRLELDGGMADAEFGMLPTARILGNA
jgi:hypothetical protein